MATTTTTLSAAVGVEDKKLTVASATSIAAGRLILVDDEFMQVTKAYVSGSTTVPVTRGHFGTVQGAHVSGVNVTHGIPSDFSSGSPAQAIGLQYVHPRRIVAYVASGAITPPTLGEDLMVKLLGTDALTMTLADPAEETEGSLLYIVANGKAAHTVTITNGLGNGSTSSDVGTFSASYGGGCTLMAVGSKWVLVGAGLYSATGATGAPTWA